MGCGQFFIDKFDELGFLLKQFEKALDKMYRGQILECQKSMYELNKEEMKEKIRILLEELNHIFEQNPKDKRCFRFKKLNEKFQYLLFEESNIIKEQDEDFDDSDTNQKGMRYFFS